MKRAKKIYDQAFRDKAVQLALSSSKPFSETAEALGIKATTLYQWLRRHQTDAEKPELSKTDVYAELIRLGIFRTTKRRLWRLKTESNRRTRLCRPLHNHSAIQPFLKVLSKLWSGKRGSNSRPQPWQGCALPLSYSRTKNAFYRNMRTHSSSD